MPLGIGQGFVQESIPGAVAEIWAGYVDKGNRACIKEVAGQCKGTFVQGQSKSGKEITEGNCRKRGGGQNAIKTNSVFNES